MRTIFLLLSILYCAAISLFAAEPKQLITSTRLIVTSPSAEYSLRADETVVSPKHTFRIEQYARTDAEDEGEWQTWIVPSAKRFEAYQLALSSRYPASYAAEYYVSPDERMLFRIQKTGSGDNYGVLFIQGRKGRYEPADVKTSFDAAAWQEFDARMHFSTDRWKGRYHEGIEFIGWGPDRETFEIALSGQHSDEDYFLRDWRIHYDLHSKKFFTTGDERRHNQRSFHWKNWRRPTDAPPRTGLRK